MQRKFIVKAASDPGLKRKHNEDMLLVNSDLLRDDSLDDIFSRDTFAKPAIFAVSDGMGGHSAGDEASKTVLHELAVAMNGLPQGLDMPALKKYFTECITDIHNGLVETAQTDKSKKGMGATLIAILFYGNKVYYINAGDSRLYRFRRGILKQLSKDHSLAEAAGYERNTTHVLLNSVGGGEHVTVDFFEATDLVISGDMFLLCSDGLTDLVEDEVIEQILDINPEPAVLINEAKKNGGDDNISVILAGVEFVDDKKETNNEFLEMLNREREGLKPMDNYEAAKFIKDNELDLKTVHSLKNINNDDATIEIYAKGNYKIVVSNVIHSTESEGDLNYSTSYGNVNEYSAGV